MMALPSFWYGYDLYGMIKVQVHAMMALCTLTPARRQTRSCSLVWCHMRPLAPAPAYQWPSCTCTFITLRSHLHACTHMPSASPHALAPLSHCDPTCMLAHTCRALALMHLHLYHTVIPLACLHTHAERWPSCTCTFITL